ncbi:MAG: Holliday junction branch migration protein RuvA [Trueperella sp.]|nr:Holliday junction branch migration protein RuvA [Trueperella sp.]
MIASVRGQVQAVGTDTAVIELGGFGMQVNCSPTTLSSLQIGTTAFLYTSFVVRDTGLTLYGFRTEDERNVFEILTTVSGIGPRTGLAVLSVLSPDELRAAVAQEDEATLTKVPGIGKKGAQRMVLELGTKLGPPPITSNAGNVVAGSAELIAALVNMGWQDREATEALRAASGELPDADAPALLRLALQILGRR